MPKFHYAPSPLPDETVHSIIAAAMHLMPDPRGVGAIVGPGATHARPIWATGLRQIAAAMPSSLGLCEERLLIEHSFVPLYLPFLSPARRARLVQATMNVGAGEPFLVVGGAASGALERLRRCPKCAAESIASHKRSGWMRIAQVGGVVLCPRHGALLETSNASRLPMEDRRRYVVAGAAEFAPSRSFLLGHELVIARSLGLSVAALLANVCAAPGPDALRTHLRERFRAAGFAGPCGKIAMQALAAEFGGWLTPTLRSAIGVADAAVSDNRSWLVRLLTRRSEAVSPVHVSLIAAFLGVSIEDVLEGAASEPSHPHSPKKPRRKGITRWHRRFLSSRALLSRLWLRRGYSIPQISARLRISHLTVRRWAVELGLPFPRPGNRAVRPPTPRKRLVPYPVRLREHRRLWISKIRRLRGSAGAARHPDTQKLYQWLNRHDGVWLRKNLPRVRRVARVDWHARDRMLAKRVREVSAQIISMSPPARASKSRILAKLHSHALANGRRKQLPRAFQALRDCTEYHADFVVRRLETLAVAGRLARRSLVTAVRKDPSLRPRGVLLDALTNLGV